MDNEESKQDDKTVSITQLDQIDSDHIIAMALQQQERAFVTLTSSESDSDLFSADNEEDDETFEFSEESLIFYAQFDEMEEEDREDSNEDLEEDDIDPDELSYEDLIALGEIVGTENKGLSPQELEPYMRPYTYKSQFESKYGFNKCVICQVEYEEGEEVAALPCQHPYHSECIRKWLQISKVCPICNAEVTSSKSALSPTT